MNIYRAGNVMEAVEMAHAFKQKGQYNWFRGQLRDWPPLSSLYRVHKRGDAEEMKRASRRIELLYTWLGEFEELRYLCEPNYIDEFGAVAQHYGVPTNYIDFSTDPGVAGFFACDTAVPPGNDGMSCIYCLDTSDLMRIWDQVRSVDEFKGMILDPIVVDVRNLWRLQSQSGVFLVANFDWELVYDMDRILFPYTGLPSYPPREIIYPKHKSGLEQMLDQYFSYEKRAMPSKELLDFINLAKCRGQYHEFEAPPDYYEREAFVADVSPLGSWLSEISTEWVQAGAESYETTVGITRRFVLRDTEEIDLLRASIEFGVRQLQRSEPTIRTKAIDWTFEQAPPALSNTTFAEHFRTVWNGMRRLPFTNDEIAAALGNVAALHLMGCKPHAVGDACKDVGRAYNGASIEIEFGMEDGTYSRGYILVESMRAALRSDIFDLLRPEYCPAEERLPDLMTYMYNPRLLFEFPLFRTMFAREVIPSQVVLGRPLVLFNPMRLKTFGLP